MDDNSLNFLSVDHFQNRYDIRVRPLVFFGIVSAVKSQSYNDKSGPGTPAA